MEKDEASPATQPYYRLIPAHPVQNIKYIVVQEDIAKGQRVESFRITAARDEAFLKSVKLYE